MSVHFIFMLSKTKHTVQTFSVLCILNIVFSLDIVLLLFPKLDDEMTWQLRVHQRRQCSDSHFTT